MLATMCGDPVVEFLSDLRIIYTALELIESTYNPCPGKLHLDLSNHIEAD